MVGNEGTEMIDDIPTANCRATYRRQTEQLEMLPYVELYERLALQNRGAAIGRLATGGAEVKGSK